MNNIRIAHYIIKAIKENSEVTLRLEKQGDVLFARRTLDNPTLTQTGKGRIVYSTLYVLHLNSIIKTIKPIFKNPALALSIKSDDPIIKKVIQYFLLNGI